MKNVEESVAKEGGAVVYYDHVRRYVNEHPEFKFLDLVIPQRLQLEEVQ